MKNKKYTVISLFSGSGGLDIGLHQTKRFNLLATVDFDKHCCNTLKANKHKLDNCTVIQADLSTLAPHDLLKKLNLKPGEVDLIVGGSPCQAFSKLGNQFGLDDLKGQLIYSYQHFIEVINPKMWLFENVPGFLDFQIKTRKGDIPLIEHYVRRFTMKGYDVQGWLVNAADYGSPQKRKRVILTGNRLGVQVETPLAEYGPPTVAEKGHCKPWLTLRDAIGICPPKDTEGNIYSQNDKKLFDLIPTNGNWKDLPEEHSKDIKTNKIGSSLYRRLKWDEPSPTIITTVRHARPGFCHPVETRPLTIREAAKIQGYPGKWIFKGGKDAKYMQIGNSVPVPLAYAVGKVLADTLDRAETEQPKRRKWKGVFSILWDKDGTLKSEIKGSSIKGSGEPLTESEKTDLKKLERQVRNHINGYLQCGKALQIICEGKLYRETHATFKDYCKDSFGLDRSTAYRYIYAVQIVENVAKLATNKEQPINECQIRSLRLLADPSDQGKAWDRAVELSRIEGNTRVSGRVVEMVVSEMLGNAKSDNTNNSDFAILDTLHKSIDGIFDLINRSEIDDNKRTELYGDLKKVAEKILTTIEDKESLSECL